MNTVEAIVASNLGHRMVVDVSARIRHNGHNQDQLRNDFQLLRQFGAFHREHESGQLAVSTLIDATLSDEPALSAAAYNQVVILLSQGVITAREVFSVIWQLQTPSANGHIAQTPPEFYADAAVVLSEIDFNLGERGEIALHRLLQHGLSPLQILDCIETATRLGEILSSSCEASERDLHDCDEIIRKGADVENRAAAFLLQTAAEDSQTGDVAINIVMNLVQDEVLSPQLILAMFTHLEPRRDEMRLSEGNQLTLYQAGIRLLRHPDEQSLREILQSGSAHQERQMLVRVVETVAFVEQRIPQILISPEYRQDAFWGNIFAVHQEPTFSSPAREAVWRHIGATSVDERFITVLEGIKRNMEYRTGEQRETAVRILAIITQSQDLATRDPAYQYLFRLATSENSELQSVAAEVIAIDLAAIEQFLQPRSIDRLIRDEQGASRAMTLLLRTIAENPALNDQIRFAIAATIQTSFFDTEINRDLFCQIVQGIFPDRLNTPDYDRAKLVLDWVNSQIARSPVVRSALANGAG